MEPERGAIRTADGLCPAYTFRPGARPALPAVLVYMDGIGIRPAMFEIATRIAQAGYHVLLPDLFYRAGPYPPMDAKTAFTDPVKRAELMSRFMPSASVANAMRDTGAFLEHLAGRSDVLQPKVGVTGYCMGGRLALSAAAHFPDRVAAAASFHGGNLANDAPESPHRMADRIKGRVYVAGAIEDKNFPDEQKALLAKALTDATVDHRIETYPARHGWVPTDHPAHDPTAAERHWKTLIDFFDRSLKR